MDFWDRFAKEVIKFCEDECPNINWERGTPADCIECVIFHGYLADFEQKRRKEEN